MFLLFNYVNISLLFNNIIESNKKSTVIRSNIFGFPSISRWLEEFYANTNTNRNIPSTFIASRLK